MIPNEQLLKQIHGRKGLVKNPFGYGITTAASYVKQFAEHCGDINNLAGMSPGGMMGLAKTVKDADQRLVYSDPGSHIQSMVKADSSARFRDIFPKDSEIEIPKNTLMVFEHIVTTPSEDRDNDVLKTEGAQVDPKTVLLWQHMPSLPLGKMMVVSEHTKDVLKMITALVDINDLTSDVAKMVEADILRISHGFRALEFNERKAKDGEFPGFEITKFEIMEVSLVSIPSNVDAEIEQFSSAKFTSDVMKGYASYMLKAHETGQVRGNSTATEGDLLVISGDPDTGVPKGILVAEEITEPSVGPAAEIKFKVKVDMSEAEDLIDDLKAGKVLSKTNETKLNDAVDDLTEAAKMEGISRAAKSLINGAKSKVKAVVASAGSGDTDDGKQVATEADVLNYFLGASSKTAHQTASKVKTILHVHDQADLGCEFDSFFNGE